MTRERERQEKAREEGEENVECRKERQPLGPVGRPAVERSRPEERERERESDREWVEGRRAARTLRDRRATHRDENRRGCAEEGPGSDRMGATNGPEQGFNGSRPQVALRRRLQLVAPTNRRRRMYPTAAGYKAPLGKGCGRSQARAEWLPARAKPQRGTWPFFPLPPLSPFSFCPLPPGPPPGTHTHTLTHAPFVVESMAFVLVDFAAMPQSIKDSSQARFSDRATCS